MKHRSSITKTAFMKKPISFMGPPDSGIDAPWMLNPAGMTDSDELRGLQGSVCGHRGLSRQIVSRILYLIGRKIGDMFRSAIVHEMQSSKSSITVADKWIRATIAVLLLAGILAMSAT